MVQPAHNPRRLHRGGVSIIEDMARDIALIEPNPVDWGGWMNYLLEQIEGEAQKREKKGGL